MASADGGSLVDELDTIVALSDVTAGYVIEGLRPEAVALPSDLQELRRVMAMAAGSDSAVAPWGGGTQTALGNRLERLDLVVDLSRLTEVQHNPGDLTATVQAGVTISELQRALGEHGQFLALDPPLPDRATVGGTLAAGLSGPLKWQYGSPRDTVIGMTVVQADGRVTKSGGRVVKNVSGYDMARLHVGGLGTLGVIADVSFKLTPRPAAEATVVASFDASLPCLEAALGIFESNVVPLALTVFDGVANGRMGALDPADDRRLAVRLGGRPLTLERMINECRAQCDTRGPRRVEVIGEQAASSLWRRLADFGYDDATAPQASARAFVSPSQVSELTDTLERSGDPQGLVPAIVSHPAHGTLLVRWYSGAGTPPFESFAAVLQAARDGAHELGGRMIIEQCPAEVKPRFDVWDDVGEPIAIMRRLKEQYDPGSVLNPGRFVGGI